MTESELYDLIFRSKVDSGKNYSQLQCLECIKLTNKMLENEVTQMIEKHEKLLGINFVRQNLRGPMKQITNEPNPAKTLNISVRGTNKFIAATSSQINPLSSTISFIEKPVQTFPSNPVT